MAALSEQLFLLEILKEKLCMSEEGLIYKITGWQIMPAQTGEDETKTFFGKVKKRKWSLPERLAEYHMVWSKHLGTGYHSYNDTRAKTSSEILNTLKHHVGNMNRYRLMVEDLKKFGFTVVPETEEEKVKKEIGL